ncbi:hypothetical protein IWQ60_005469 [Tieghemiomyces parasiticus]|uniref:Uncharacterized protein n=1 Tax=Tieghemiomyces parasiticus TaxID=78921 RepID=A0A9W8DUL1_9FUNG|nr:hypothetical protein IWQ60_005469 [Tieghemiomyces parasiticus]
MLLGTIGRTLLQRPGFIPTTRPLLALARPRLATDPTLHLLTVVRWKMSGMGPRPLPPEDVRIDNQGRVVVGDCYLVTQPYPQNKIPNRAAARHIKKFHFTKKRTERNQRLWQFYSKVRERNGQCYLKSNDYHFMLDRFIFSSKKMYKTYVDYNDKKAHLVSTPLVQISMDDRTIVRTLCADWLDAFKEGERQVEAITPLEWATVFLGRPPPYLIQMEADDFDRIVYAYGLLGDVDTAIGVIENEVIPRGYRPSTASVNQLILACGQLGHIEQAEALYQKRLPQWGLTANGRILTSLVITYAKDGRLDAAHQIFNQIVQRRFDVYQAFTELSEAYHNAGRPKMSLMLRQELVRNGLPLTPPPRDSRGYSPWDPSRVKGKLLYGRAGRQGLSPPTSSSAPRPALRRTNESWEPSVQDRGNPQNTEDLPEL